MPTNNREQAVTSNDNQERTVYYFCQSEKNAYIDPDLKFAAFKAAKCDILSFHQQHLTPDALRTAIDLFSSQLGDYLWALNYKETDGARPKVRDAVRLPANKIQALLDVVNANYK